MSHNAKFRANVKRSLAAHPMIAEAAQRFLDGANLTEAQKTLAAQNLRSFTRAVRYLKNTARLVRIAIDSSGQPFILKGKKRPVSKPASQATAPTKSKDFGFYSTEVWKRLRYQALVASDGCCKCCGASARDGAIMRVDHIKPISKHPELKADPTNLQVLCNDCNWGKGAWDETDWRPPSKTRGDSRP